MGDLMVPARTESGIDMGQGPSGPGHTPDDEGKDKDANKENQGEDENQSRGDKVFEINLGALERNRLK